MYSYVIIRQAPTAIQVWRHKERVGGSLHITLKHKKKNVSAKMTKTKQCFGVNFLLLRVF